MLALMIPAMMQRAQQGFNDPFSKTGFHAGDLYSSLGNSSIDATSGRLVYSVPLASLPRNGNLPQGISLLYNSSHIGMISGEVKTTTTGGMIVRNPVQHYNPNFSSTLGYGWRLSFGTVVLGTYYRGLVFIDSSGAEHPLIHTDGCPPDVCPTNWSTNGKLNPAINEMQENVHRSSDATFYKAVVRWGDAQHTVANITGVDVFSPDGTVFVFNDFRMTARGNPAISGFQERFTRTGEVSEIRDVSGNRLLFSYDNSDVLHPWQLRWVYDGSRYLRFNYNFGPTYTALTLQNLIDQHYITDCVDSGQPDSRSCRTNYTPPDVAPPYCPQNFGDSCDGCGWDDDPPTGGGTTPATYSGKFLSFVEVGLSSSENGALDEKNRQVIRMETRRLCRTVLQDHYKTPAVLPKFETTVKAVELNQATGDGPVSYRFQYLPDGTMRLAKNPLGAEEEFIWESYEPLRWFTETESCETIAQEEDNSVTGGTNVIEETPLVPCGSACSTSCVEEGGADVCTVSCQELFCLGTTVSNSGGYPSIRTSGSNASGTTCAAGQVLVSEKCEEFKVSPTPVTNTCTRTGPNVPTSCNPLAYVGCVASPDKDKNCLCLSTVIDRKSLNATCDQLGGDFNGSTNGVRSRLLRTTGESGGQYAWTYTRLFDDRYITPEPGTTRNYTTRRYMEIANPDGTRERLYFRENATYSCNAEVTANKQGMPSAREVLDAQGFVVMREEYEYKGFAGPGNAQQRYSPFNRTLLGFRFDLKHLLGDYFRVATTTIYYKPHPKPSLASLDLAGTQAVRLSPSDTHEHITWNDALNQSAGGGSKLYTDAQGLTLVDLPYDVAQRLANGEYDAGEILYAHRSEVSEHLELGHFARSRECDATRYRLYRHGPLTGRDTVFYRYTCKGDPAPKLPYGFAFDGAPVDLPPLGNDFQETRSLWNPDKNPATNTDRLNWTIHTPRQQFLLDRNHTIVSAGQTRFDLGRPAQSRAASVAPFACGVDGTKFPSFTAHNFNNLSYQLPGDLALGICPSRDQDGDTINRLGRDSQGNLIRQDIALGDQANFSDNSAGALIDPFAMKFTWQSGSPINSEFDVSNQPGAIPYKNQERTVSALTGLVLSEKDPNNKQTALEYDNLMRVTRITPPPEGEVASTISYPTMRDAILTKGDTEMQYHYDGLGRVWKTDKKMPDGTRVFQYTGYDTAGRKAFMGEWTRTTYEPRGALFDCDLTGTPVIPAASRPDGTQTCFDALGRPSKIIAADGSTTEYRYLGVDSLVRVFKNKAIDGQPATDSANDQVTKYYHDAFGRLIMVDTDCRLNWGDPAAVANLDCGSTVGLGADAIYNYDVAGRLIRVNLIPQLTFTTTTGIDSMRMAYISCELNPATCTVIPIGQLRTFEYDSLGRLKAACNPENGCVNYLDYDALGNVLEVQDEQGKVVPAVKSSGSGHTVDCPNDTPPDITAITLSNTSTEPCPNGTPVGTICLVPTTQTLGLRWIVSNTGNACLAATFTAALTLPGGYTKTNPCSGTNTQCSGTSFDLRQNGVVATGDYGLQLTVTNVNGTVSAVKTYAISIPPTPPNIQFVNPALTVTDASASFSYASTNAPPCDMTGCPYVSVSVSPAVPGFDATLKRPLTSAVSLNDLYGHNQSYNLLLVLRTGNGSELDNTAWSFTVNRAGSYTLRYSYDKRGRLTAVRKLDLATGDLTALTKVAYDNYATLLDGADIPYFSDPGAGNAPLGKKTGALSDMDGITIAQAVEYLGMGGRPSVSRLAVDDGNQILTYETGTSYNDLGLPATLTYPRSVGGSLTSSSVYTAGYLQGLSGNTTDTGVQKNYLTGLSYNPAGTLANFTLGNGAATAMTYDNRNRPLTIENRITPSLSFNSGLYQYDGAGNITNIGPQSFNYDRLNRLTFARVTRTLASGVSSGWLDTSYHYDSFGNMDRKYASGGSIFPNPADTSNPFLNALTFGSPALGQPVRIYDSGAPAAPAGTTPLPAYSITNKINEIGFVYDLNGNLRQDPKNCYEYDVLNRMTSAAPKANGACGAKVANYFYDADNLRAVKQLMNTDSGTVSKLVTSLRGGLDAISDLTTHVNDGNASPFTQKNYLYGPGGLIASEERNITYQCGGQQSFTAGGGGTAAAAGPPLTVTGTAPVGWDGVLNFGTCDTPGLRSVTVEWHELRSTGVPKDCTRMDLEDPIGTDARNNCGVIHIPAAGNATLIKLKYGKTYSFVATANYDLGLQGLKNEVFAQFTASLSSTTAMLVYVAEIESRLAASCAAAIIGPRRFQFCNAFPTLRDVKYYQKDHLGTIRVASNESGAVLSTHDYEPFGLELPGQDPSDNTHRFTGHERDTETILDYMKARYYGASMGRFGAVDISSASMQQLYPQSFNRYSYGANNPLLYLDQNGKWLTYVHNLIIKYSFSNVVFADGYKVTSNDINSIQHYAARFDTGGDPDFKKGSPTYSQATKNSYMHSMNAPDEPAADARVRTAAFVNEHIDLAVQAWLVNDKEGAFRHLAIAQHPPSDSLSPEHNTTWYGMDGFINKARGVAHGAGELVPSFFELAASVDIVKNAVINTFNERLKTELDKLKTRMDLINNWTNNNSTDNLFDNRCVMPPQ